MNAEYIEFAILFNAKNREKMKLKKIHFKRTCVLLTLLGYFNFNYKILINLYLIIINIYKLILYLF